MDRGNTFAETLVEWGRISRRTFPWREGADPFEILVAEILLQKTFAQKVVRVYEALLASYPNPESLADADEGELETLLEPLGLQKRKAQTLVSVAADIVELGGVPDSEEALLELDGVGPYSANAVLCFGFGHRRPIVDANVVRIYERLFSQHFSDSWDQEAWTFADELLPNEYYQEYNLALLDLGALICTASQPDCENCPVNGYCDYYAEVTVT